MTYTIESEVKYRVTGLSLKSCNPSRIVGDVIDFVEGTGVDVFYYRPELRMKEFLRYRHNPDGQELTRKVKLSTSNVNRIEENIKLRDDETLENIDRFVRSGGYVKGNTIRKDYLVWWGALGILSYYKVYVGNVFQGSFVEIEAYSDETETERAEALEIMRDNLKEFAELSDNHIEQKSMFEIFGV